MVEHVGVLTTSVLEGIGQYRHCGEVAGKVHLI
jgi:hypothetical protein